MPVVIRNDEVEPLIEAIESIPANEELDHLLERLDHLLERLYGHMGWL